MDLRDIEAIEHGLNKPMFLERRKELLEYMKKIPQEKVNLNTYVLSENGSTEGDDVRRHLKAVGYEALECGTIGCLAGWMYTMPSYVKYREDQGLNPGCVSLCTGDMEVFLGMKDQYTPLFRARMEEESVGKFRDMNDHQVAIYRCEKIVKDLEDEINADQEKASGVAYGYD